MTIRRRIMDGLRSEDPKVFDTALLMADRKLREAEASALSYSEGYTAGTKDATRAIHLRLTSRRPFPATSRDTIRLIAGVVR